MDRAEETTYEPLEEGRSSNGSGRHQESMDSPECDRRAPKDQKHAVYLALLAAGIGFVLPYNSFIIAADYWQARFPGRSVALDMSMTYIIVSFATVLLNNVFLAMAPFRLRVTFGYVISFTTLIFVAVCEVAWHMFASSSAYSANLVAVTLVAIGSTVQQSSFYGFASMMPKQYTQAVMAGESIAGFLVSSNRVVTKLLIQNDRVSTVIFFLTSTTYILFSYLLHLATIESPFVQYYMKACSKIVLRPDESEIDGATSSTKYDMLTLDGTHATSSVANGHGASGSNTNALSFCNPVYELSNPTAGESIIEGLNNLPELPPTPQEPTTPTTVAFKVEHVITPGNCTTPGKWSDLREGFVARWRVAQTIYPYMVCIALAYCVTLSLYPGIESEINSCSLRTWLPVLLMFAFNTADVIGKILAAVPYPWSRRQLILMSGLRIVLVPMLLLCCAPRHRPVISGETPAFVFTAALGISNGLAGSLPMMLAPAKVPATLKEVTGNMMTLSYNVGLTAGSLIGYVFESMLGPQLTSPCPTYPYVPATMLEQMHGHISITTPVSTVASAATISSTISAHNATSTIDSASMATALVTSTFSSLLISTTTAGGNATNATTVATTVATVTFAPAVTTVATTTAAAIYSTIAGTIASIPEAVNILTSTVMSAVSSVGDISLEGSTTDPQTPMELLQQI